MNVHVRIGDNRTFSLKQAVLALSGGQQSLCHVARGEVPAGQGTVLVCGSVGHDGIS